VRNKIHSLPGKHGLRIPCKTKFIKKAATWLKEQSLSPFDDIILQSDLTLLEVLDDLVPHRRGALGDTGLRSL
jgi:hypothetical protein